MSEREFLGTNTLMYAHDDGDRDKQDRARDLIGSLTPPCVRGMFAREEFGK